MNPIKKISFIGVGNMGNAMAGQLVKKGFDVTVFDARAETAQAFVKQHGGTAAATLAEAGQGADAVIFMVPDDKVVRQVLFADGLAESLAKGTIVIDMSSSAPTGTMAIGNDLDSRGIGYVDAPVMGGVIFAKDATLDIMAGGDAALVERCKPLFDAMGRKLYVCGPLGSGHVLKCLTNYINACALINTLEAMTIGGKFGLDSNVMAEAIEAMCNGRQHPVAKKVVPHVLTRKYGTGMAMQFIAKDVKIAVDSAHSIGAAAPLAEKTAELWAAACEKLGGKLDQTEIVRFWEEQTGVRL
ncbi:MAG: NAD(P)-dependent oxidoreductase [Proteobacteria bacterium]|nr:NAD(P)-dependent oxidoreductase [Pseudomonadota bacterium]